MHIPDGFIDGPTSAAAGAVAIAGLGLCARKASDVMDDKQVPLAGLVSAYVFAVQMVNFPVANGTSGHLLGGVLAAVLVGPYLGALCLSVVLTVQSLLFADGGLSALGLNIVNMALIGGLGGYVAFAALRRFLPRTAASVVGASAIAAAISVVMAAIGFTVQYALGGSGVASVGAVAAAMVGVHAVIGIGEGVITALTVSAVLATRPDLVYGARGVGAVTPVATTRTVGA